LLRHGDSVRDDSMLLCDRATVLRGHAVLRLAVLLSAAMLPCEMLCNVYDALLLCFSLLQSRHIVL
jgi:hypothetical protein